MLSDARSRFSSTSRPERRDACDQTSLGVIISAVAGHRGSRWLFTISSRGRVFLVVQASAPRRRRWRAASSEQDGAEAAGGPKGPGFQPPRGVEGLGRVFSRGGQRAFSGARLT